MITAEQSGPGPPEIGRSVVCDFSVIMRKRARGLVLFPLVTVTNHTRRKHDTRNTQTIAEHRR